MRFIMLNQTRKPSKLIKHTQAPTKSTEKENKAIFNSKII